MAGMSSATPTPPTAEAAGAAAVHRSAEADASERRKGYLALWLVQFSFGLLAVFGKWAFDDFSSESIVAWRMVVGASVLGGAVLWMRGRAAWVGRRDLVALFFLAILGVTLNMGLFLEGLRRSTAINAGLMVPLIPVFTFAIAVALKHEVFSWSRCLGIAVALSGALFLAFGRGAELTAETRVGNLMMVANALCYAIYLVLSRPIVARHGPLVVTAWVFVLALWALPLILRGHALWPEHASTRSWLSLGYILIFPTLVSYFFNAYALARVAASTAAVFIFFQSLIIVFAAVAMLGEELTRRSLICGAIVFAGSAWVLLRREPATARAH